MARIRRKSSAMPIVDTTPDVPVVDDQVRIDMAHVVMLYENRDIYDGWSVAELDDGTFVNRWPKGHGRHKAGEEYRLAIEAYTAELITTRLAEMAA